ncbi:serine/threonine protein kinase [Nitzschia inconspicua]|uniref:Serine/threonine protein kinase n=1 Tax=Nitzschia inconspicua TaxID=303405 RepID=A0A9K3L451_9STRA|nr:serine/threonine protein kinase [Nitzschia inconspicua]
MDYVWDIIHSTGLAFCPPSSAIFPEHYRDIQRDYTFVGNADMAVMGRGTFGVVRRVQERTLEMRKKNLKKYACKTVLKSKLDNPILLKNEVYNLQRCQDAPHVIKLVDVYEDFYAVHIIMEECRGMELFEELQLVGEEGLGEEQSAIVIHQALTALAYMHEVCHVAHRDIKASNFIFAHLNLMKDDGKELEIKLIDFGLSKHVVSKPSQGHKIEQNGEAVGTVTNDSSKDAGTKSIDDLGIPPTPTIDAIDSDDELLKNQQGVMTSEVGTPYYTAPEVLTQDSYDFKCDVYSVGVLAYLCLTGRLPIKGKTERETIKMVMKAKTKIDFSDELWLKTHQKEGESPKEEKVHRNGKALSFSARDFCQALLQRDPQKRPTAHEALHMDWMTTRFGEPARLPPPIRDDEELKLPSIQRVDTATLEQTLSC